ncbi:hypothetical protein [uncultured Tenacibaculum sp.]|uniref:hypothetical protein n=1 Tax=uncultured Tenacibaculum sp. TaxID=174713 RepID=UPI00260B6149|nr:hypothetical protein [uncultured Tenacibaculum sp.]
MPKNVKHINLFTLTFALVLFTLSTNAQEVRVIDNKGTIQIVRNNTVTTSATAPATPVENDVWITDTNLVSIWDGSNWKSIHRIFYPPSLALPMPSVINGTDNVGMTYNLHSDYSNQFSLPAATSAKSTSAPDLPIYAANQLWYYVTYFDPSIFQDISISDTGVMTYTVKALPTDDNTIINVVFVVK